MAGEASKAVDVVLAGATGALGSRIAGALRERGASVRAVLRRGTAEDRIASLRGIGVETVEADLDDEGQVAAACRGAACAVSALNGLAPTILGTQGVLLRAAVAAGVPRFIPSDFSLDFTKTRPGDNRNLDLRRDFHRVLDAAPIRATSILNGGFTDLIVGPAPFILFPIKRVLHFGDADQRVDFTTMDDTAAFTARAALDPGAPRVLRISGDETSPRGIAASASAATGQSFTTMRAGSLRTLSALIVAARTVMPGRRAVFPPFQGLQYMRDMFSGRGKLAPLDNARYSDMRWTSVREVVAGRKRSAP
ncbi:NmrA family NAD(P)-binding protein [Lichenibacterium dinghuense]|uniref:NmrA family NAD(P)-binding protein n=1 Tax=Lichenibacterium dinghuense TaxID=2895977 RepID=UPI001F366727|nr:NmrA family NAD(P)-binding protein [Lichenibacterium sp. 6Y81]